MGNTGARSEERSSNAIGVGFIDILFGLAAAPAFTALSATPIANSTKWSHLLVALAVVTFSWVGFHNTRAFDHLDVSFTSPMALQLLIDIVIVGLYFALARNAMVGDSSSVTVETALLAAVFVMYLKWDLVGIVIHSDTTDAGLMARKRVIASAIWTLIFVGCAIIFATTWSPNGKGWVIAIDTAYIGALYGYRVKVQFAEGKARMNHEIHWEALLRAAERVADSAYAPHSEFRVGAAVLTDDGRVFVGCNVENASYGLTICAERSAVFAAVAATPGHKLEIRAVAIATDPPIPGSPCGACRQVIAEFGLDATVSYISTDGRVQRSLHELLPDAFTIE